MNELAIKIAELLDVTVDAAMNMYPVIREQYMWYSLMGKLGELNTWIGGIAIMSLFVLLMHVDDEDEAQKVFKWLVFTGVFVIIAWFLLVIFTHITAPDIVLIKGLAG